MSRKLAYVVCGLAAVAGCVSARNLGPIQSWDATASADELATCLVPALLIKHSFPGDPDITHKVDTIVPGKVYEVQPQQTITLGVERYFVRLTVKESGGTLVELYADPTFRSRTLKAVKSCLK